MTGEKSAPDHIVDANKMAGAPAEMPGVEEIARTIYHCKPRNKPWDILPHEFKNQYRKPARAILALFAPILAEWASEKERADMAVGQMIRQNDRILAAESSLAELRKQMLADEGQHSCT